MRLFPGAAIAFLIALTAPTASAQDRHHDRQGPRHAQDGYGDWGNRGGDDSRRPRRQHHRNDGDRLAVDRPDRGYARGQRYRGDGTYLSDYRRYGYRAPPQGYRYYRSGNGDVVLAAVATGIITSVIANGNRGD